MYNNFFSPHSSFFSSLYVGCFVCAVCLLLFCHSKNKGNLFFSIISFWYCSGSFQREFSAHFPLRQINVRERIYCVSAHANLLKRHKPHNQRECTNTYTHTRQHKINSYIHMHIEMSESHMLFNARWFQFSTMNQKNKIWTNDEEIALKKKANTKRKCVKSFIKNNSKSSALSWQS